MKLLLVLIAASLPLFAGTVIAIDANNPIPTIAGSYSPSELLDITVTGTANLLGLSDGSWITTPNGALVNPIPDDTYWNHLYQYANATGGSNYDPYNEMPWAPEGKQAADLNDPQAIRLGTLAYTFAADPSRLDWQTLGSGGMIPTGDGGELRLVVADTFYPNNTGSYRVDIAENPNIPEPGTLGLLVVGMAVIAAGYAVFLDAQER